MSVQPALAAIPADLAAGQTWAIGGARRLSQAEQRAAAIAARLLLAAGAELVVGCCRGADEAVLRAAVAASAAERVRVLCAFGELPAPPRPAAAAPGTCAHSAVCAVALAAAAGARVQPWAGGGAGVPLAARLSRRTRAVAAAATAGALVLLRRDSAGSLLLARAVAERGLPVLVLPVGPPWQMRPDLGSGGWAVPPADSLCGWLGARLQALYWAPAQRSLFE